MSKFKVGDRVELVGNQGLFFDGYVNNNTTGIIDNIGSEGIMRFCIKIDKDLAKDLNHYQYTGHESDLKLVSNNNTKEEVKDDVINNPKHYTQGKIEPLSFIEDQRLEFHEAQVIKYVVRARYKDNEIQDLRKAMFYLERKIKILENKNET